MGVSKKELKSNILLDWGKKIRRFYKDNPNRSYYILIALVILISLIPVYINSYQKTNEKANVLFEYGLISFRKALTDARLTYDEKMKHFNSSVTYFNNLKVMYPGKPIASDAIFYMGNCYYYLGNIGKAIEMYNLYYKKYRRKYLAPYALENVAAMYEQLGNYNTAISNYERLKNVFDGKSVAGKAYYSMGVCYEALGNYQQAYNSYQNVINFYPDTYWANDARLKLKWLESKFKYYQKRR